MPGTVKIFRKRRVNFHDFITRNRANQNRINILLPIQINTFLSKLVWPQLLQSTLAWILQLYHNDWDKLVVAVHSWVRHVEADFTTKMFFFQLEHFWIHLLEVFGGAFLVVYIRCKVQYVQKYWSGAEIW